MRRTDAPFPSSTTTQPSRTFLSLVTPEKGNTSDDKTNQKSRMSAFFPERLIKRGSLTCFSSWRGRFFRASPGTDGSPAGTF